MSMMNTIMNGDGGRGGGGAAAAPATSARGTVSKRVPGMPLISGRNKDRDHEDLILFQELHKRQKERNILSLLQPVSDEFEPTGNYQLYRTAAAQKGSGFEFLTENDKNDYDWLKTPPATPLFPSLEMDTNGPELVIQREIPILQPLSRFAGGNCNSEAVERRNGHGRPKSPNPKQKIPVMIPSQRRSSSSSSSTVSSNVNAQTKNSSKARARAVPAVVNHHLNQKAAVESDGDLTRLKRSANNNNNNNNNVVNESNNANNIDQKDGSRSSTSGAAAADFVSSSRAMGEGVKMVYSKAKPTTASSTSTRRGGVSIVSSSTQIAAGFCNEKPPPNLRTEQRSTSASTTRGRGRASATHQIQKAADHHQPAAKLLPRRQSCSPSVSRGRKVVEVQEEATTTSLKGRIQFQTGNGTQVLGSRMVQRVMNARKSVTRECHHEEKDHKKPNTRFPIRESSGFGRILHGTALPN